MKFTATLARLVFAALISVTLLAALTTPTSATNKKILAISPKIVSAKTIYFENQTGNSAVGDKALAELRKWGRFQIVNNAESADLAIILSAVRYSSGMILFGKPLDHDTDSAPPEFAYLTILDPSTHDLLYSDSTRWGGLITGVNSAGVHLVKKLKQQIPK